MSPAFFTSLAGVVATARLIHASHGCSSEPGSSSVGSMARMRLRRAAIASFSAAAPSSARISDFFFWGPQPGSAGTANVAATSKNRKRNRMGMFTPKWRVVGSA